MTQCRLASFSMMRHEGSQRLSPWTKLGSLWCPQRAPYVQLLWEKLRGSFASVFHEDCDMSCCDALQLLVNSDHEHHLMHTDVHAFMWTFYEHGFTHPCNEHFGATASAPWDAWMVLLSLCSGNGSRLNDEHLRLRRHMYNETRVSFITLVTLRCAWTNQCTIQIRILSACF